MSTNTNSAGNPSSTPSAAKGVPLLDLGRQYALLRDETAAALLRVCDSGQFVLGPAVTELEKSVAGYCGTIHAVGCASGSDALLLALMALDIGPGDEVIVPSFTFFATASAVTRLGAQPVFVDIDPVTYNMDPGAIQRRINPATKAIIPVHLFGQPAEMGAICRIAERAGVAVIEDAAQAIGAEFHGRRVGSIGAIGCFSFYPTKNLGGAGDGGMLTTNRDDLADRLRLLRGHGMRPRYYHQVVGVNSRLDSLQAAILNVKMPHLDRWTAQRQENANRYTRLFTDAHLNRVLGLPTASPDDRHVWNQYVIRVPEGRRDEMRQWLAEAKIGSEIYYPLGLHQQACYRNLGYTTHDLPETERAAQEVLALPIFPELTAEEQQLVVARIAAFYAPRGHAISAPKFLQQVGTRHNA
jgi:dTDP-4-amino-4,6-dideoxygalactose transaminase